MARKAKYTVEEQREMYEEMSNQHNNPLLKNARIELQFKHDNQKTFAELINSKEIILCSGPAGGGKTYVASAMALKLVKDQPLKYRKIYLIKSVTTLKDEEIGFLKGTMEEKMEPFVFSFIHNLEKIVGKSIIESMRGRHEIEVMPLAYTRGISLDNCMLPGTTIKLDSGKEIEVSELYEMFDKSEEPILVQSYNLESDKIEIKELSAISKNPVGNEPVFEIETEDGRIIKLTGGHRLWVKDRGYIEVKDILETDELLTIHDIDLIPLKIKSIKKIECDPTEVRYSVNVEDNHNYFLNDGILSKNCIVLIDETQNLTKDHLVTLMTRIGSSCKLILMGDTDQVDRKIKSESGMKWIISKLENIDGIGIVNFTLADVVRNPIISKILEAVKE